MEKQGRDKIEKMELWDSFDKHLLRWVAKFSQLEGRSCGCGKQLKRWGDSGRGRERGWWLKSGERELDEKGFKERSLQRVRMWGLLQGAMLCLESS